MGDCYLLGCGILMGKFFIGDKVFIYCVYGGLWLMVVYMVWVNFGVFIVDGD